MIPTKGTPTVSGRYIAFVPTEISTPNGHYVEPIIAVWSGGKWHKDDRGPVLGFIGPLPVMLVSDFVNSQKYDL